MENLSVLKVVGAEGPAEINNIQPMMVTRKSQEKEGQYGVGIYDFTSRQGVLFKLNDPVPDFQGHFQGLLGNRRSIPAFRSVNGILPRRQRPLEGRPAKPRTGFQTTLNTTLRFQQNWWNEQFKCISQMAHLWVASFIGRSLA